MPMLNMRFVLPDHIIDLNRVEGLSYIREAKGWLEIGAMTRQRDLEFSDAAEPRYWHFFAKGRTGNPARFGIISLGAGPSPA